MGEGNRDRLTVPLLDLKAQYAPLREQIRAAIDRVCDAQSFILGAEVDAFEREVAAFVGAKHAIGISSGTDALLAALMALDVAPGDEIITPTYSFFATAGAIARLQAVPVFVDIEPDTFNLDPDQIEPHITGQTRAIMPVHLFGRCANMAAIMEVAERHGLPVIEDAAQAIGATDELGRTAGTIGTFGCFSFFPTKNLGAFGDAGLITTNDDALADRVRAIRVHGSRTRYYHDEVGGNFRLDALQAAVLRVKLPHLSAWTAARRRNALRYRELLSRASSAESVALPGDTAGHVYNQFVIRARKRDRLRAWLQEQGIGTEVYYPLPLHRQACFRGLTSSGSGFSNAEHVAAEALALPVYPELTAAQQVRVAEEISRFYDGVRFRTRP